MSSIYGLDGCVSESCDGSQGEGAVPSPLTFEATMKRVVSGESFAVTSAKWVPSMLETKCTRGPPLP